MDSINYSELTEKHPWILEKNHKAVISPDSDGLLCGLLMSHYLGWEISGYYDGKILLLNKDLKAKDCIFLDVEIFRREIRSVGQHMVLYDKEDPHPNWTNFENCIQPNNLRGYDIKHNFNKKYPLATIHFLLAILGSKQEIEIKKDALTPLFYADGTFKNLFNFPENCLCWIRFLGGDERKTCLHKIFYNEHYKVIDLMATLKEFFEKLKKIGNEKRGGDKIKISNSKGELINVEQNAIISEEKEKAEKFLKLLSNLTGWDYNADKWSWRDFNILKFTKGTVKPSKKRYKDLMEKNPLSLANTSTLTIEYTIEEPDKLI